MSVGRGESEDVDEGDETGEADHVDFRAQVGRTIEVPLTELICAKKSRRTSCPFLHISPSDVFVVFENPRSENWLTRVGLIVIGGCQPFEMLDKLKLVIALGDDEFEPVERVEEDDEWEIILEGGKDADELGGGQTGPTWAAVVARS